MTGEPNNKEATTSETSAIEDPVNTEGTREPKTSATSAAGPDVGAAAPESGAREQQKQQGADRPGEEPQAEGADAIVSKKEDAENAMSKDTSDEPKPLEGPGETKGGDKENLGSTSKEPGTGTQYVKSSGLAAEGGDFDATKPGAGKEADREFLPTSPTFAFVLTFYRPARRERHPSRRKYRSASRYSER